MTDLFALPWRALAPFVVIGFCAQLVDGTIGMGFGVLTNTALVAMGIRPAPAAAIVRTVAGFASGVSGLNQAWRGNVDWPLFARLVVPGIVGGVCGAWLLAQVGQNVVRPVVFAYLGAIGMYLVWRAPRRPQTYRSLRLVAPVGLLGALVDATGGGWGPVVAGHLLAQGGNPRAVIGTVNAAAFFVTVTVLGAFIGTLGAEAFTVATCGLLIGSILAAPIGALLVRRLAPRTLTTIAGGFLVMSSFYGLLSLAIRPLPVFPRF